MKVLVTWSVLKTSPSAGVHLGNSAFRGRFCTVEPVAGSSWGEGVWHKKKVCGNKLAYNSLQLKNPNTWVFTFLLCFLEYLKYMYWTTQKVVAEGWNFLCGKKGINPFSILRSPGNTCTVSSFVFCWQWVSLFICQTKEKGNVILESALTQGGKYRPPPKI